MKSKIKKSIFWVLFLPISLIALISTLLIDVLICIVETLELYEIWSFESSNVKYVYCDLCDGFENINDCNFIGTGIDSSGRGSDNNIWHCKSCTYNNKRNDPKI